MDLLNWLWLSLLLAAVAVLLASPVWRHRAAGNAGLLATLVAAAVVGEMALRFLGIGESLPLSAWAITLFVLWMAISGLRSGIAEPELDDTASKEPESPPSASEMPVIDDPFRRRHVAETGRLPRMALEQAALGIVALDLEGTVEIVNAAWARMHGYRDDEARGHHVSLFHTPDQMEAEIGPRLAQAKETGSWEGVAGHRRKDGSVFSTRMSLTLLRNRSGEPVGFVAVAGGEGRVADGEGRVAADEGPGPRVAGGDSETLSVLVGKVAHQFNNLLTGILGNANLASRALGPGAPGQEEIQEILTASRRASELSKTLQAYCREVRPTHRPTDAPSRPPPQPEPPQPEPEDNGTILVVDNEKIIRDLATTILETYGYSVTTANDGEPAVELYRQRGADFHVVLLDLSMPLMDGAEAFRLIRQLDPRAQIILMTGHPAQEVLADFADDRPAGVLQKPFKPDQLLGALRGILGTSAAV